MIKSEIRNKILRLKKSNGFSSAVCVRSISAVELFCIASAKESSDDVLLDQLNLHLASRLGDNVIQNEK